jgi:hypothetical protein
MRFGDDGVESYYNSDHPEFKKIMEESKLQDSGALFGFEFLIYLGAQKEFCTLYLNSKSSRKEAPNLKGLIGKFATLKIKFIETKKYSWHVPVCFPCSTPFELPPTEEIHERVAKFIDVKDSDVETVQEVAGEETRER